MVGTAMDSYGDIPGTVNDPPGVQGWLKCTKKADTDEAGR